MLVRKSYKVKIYKQNYTVPFSLSNKLPYRLFMLQSNFRLKKIEIISKMLGVYKQTHNICVAHTRLL